MKRRGFFTKLFFGAAALPEVVKGAAKPVYEHQSYALGFKAMDGDRVLDISNLSDQDVKLMSRSLREGFVKVFDSEYSEYSEDFKSLVE